MGRRRNTSQSRRLKPGHLRWSLAGPFPAHTGRRFSPPSIENEGPEGKRTPDRNHQVSASALVVTRPTVGAAFHVHLHPGTDTSATVTGTMQFPDGPTKNFFTAC